MWNYLIKGISNTISRNKGELSKLNNKKKKQTKFLCNRIKWKSKTFKISGHIAMPNDLGNHWGKDPLQHFILRKSNQFDLKLGELINLIFWFCVDQWGFSTLSGSCHSIKENSVFTVTVTTIQKAKICGAILWWTTPKNIRVIQQVVSEIKCCNYQIFSFVKNGFKVKN